MAETVVNAYGVEIDFEAAVMLMDGGLVEALHREMAPCSPQTFFEAYCLADPGFELAKPNPVY